MKKIIYSLSAALALTTSLQAQNAIPNGGFESWTSATYDYPQSYLNSNPGSFFRTNAAFNVVKTTDAFHGSYALQLTTNVGVAHDTNMAYIIDASNTNGNPCQWSGGIPYNQKPTGLHGNYKSNVAVGDSAGIIVAFRSGGTCLGMYIMKFYGTHNAYTPFTLSFSPALSATPDSMIFAAVSSDVFGNIQKAGSMLQLDSLSFTGGVSQPAAFNGDFENWQSQTVKKPNNWYLQTDDQGDGIFQTTDAQAGTYAMELKTVLGQRGNGNVKTPAAQGAGISTGYSNNNCGGGPNCLRGGYPFTNQVDTLAFYYKYVPSGNDTGEVSINFKKNTTGVWSTGAPLRASATYKYMEVPFNTSTAIDTVIVSFQSTNWRDSSVSFVGSDLKIDQVHFKSQSLAGIKKYDANASIAVFPNPSNGVFTITHIQGNDLVRVYNVYGQEINAAITKDGNDAHVQIDAPGAYFIYINSGGKITSHKVIVL
ncbi:MAG TPA: T9SS type A sorting domain-containing protein [Bacteroidia bacterium]|jgi:hypothetical protein|nr:T9SS type A sorting domain-containing protein [Bacteroidia bacterium]